MLGCCCKQFLLLVVNGSARKCSPLRVAAARTYSAKKAENNHVSKKAVKKAQSLQSRWNPLNIQMLSSDLHRDIFRGGQNKRSKVENDSLDARIERSKRHLEKHKLIGKTVKATPEVRLKLPRLHGKNIDDHFRVLARTQSEDHRVLARTLADNPLPPLPKEWSYSRGWTAYHADGSTEAVDFPADQALVFDIECCVTEGNYPTLAVAASPTTWYSWCSERLVEGRLALTQRIGLEELIPLESSTHRKPTKKDLLPRLIVGHNVSFDRSFVKEQYYVQKSWLHGMGDFGVSVTLKSLTHRKPTKKDLLPRLIVGHNVSSDRRFVKEQYYVQKTKLCFLDTLSLHMCVSGLTTYQKSLWMGQGNGAKDSKKSHQRRSWNNSNGNQINSWQNESSPNNLVDVYNCHIKNGMPLDKTKRETFVTGTMEDVRQDFQALMTYCAEDVSATHQVFQVLLDGFFERFEHPVTFAAMLEMGQCYLPVNRNWERYLQEAQEMYENLRNEMKILLMQIANENCQYQHDEMYKDDPWLWDLDWSVEKFRLVKKYYDSLNPSPPKRKRKKKTEQTDAVSEEAEDGSSGKTDQEAGNHAEPAVMMADGQGETGTSLPPLVGDGIDEIGLLGSREGEGMDMATAAMIDWEDEAEVEAEERFLAMRERFQEMQSFLPKKSQHMVGYPGWYRDLCPRNDPDPGRGPTMISSQTRVTPKLLRMTWEGYPLHFIQGLGWGYLVPKYMTDSHQEDTETGENIVKDEDESSESDKNDDPTTHKNVDGEKVKPVFPIRSLLALLKARKKDKVEEPKVHSTKSSMEQTEGGDRGPFRQGRYPSNVDVNGCWFYKLPHKDGGDANVGNPLAKDFLNKLEDGTLSTEGGLGADKILEINKLISYWRNASKRIVSQMVINLERPDLPSHVTKSPDYEDEVMCGAILPRVITAGTVTRRAVEPTWLTATNALPNRVGSELKGMVQAPPGYHFVGADVDSQELWIAAILGDSNFVGIHGCTALGWMTLQGSKKDATDMHSVTANTVGISRNHAKVINYARIYGAGKKFARHLLMQFNHSLSSEEALEKAKEIFATTKGDVMYRLLPAGEDLCRLLDIKEDDVEDGWISAKELNQFPAKLKKLYSDDSDDSVRARALVPPTRGLRLSQLVNVLTDKQAWFNGSESYMFNKLEDIAMSKEPRTPVLGCRISRALEPDAVNNEFLTSRVNWVVQSSAVDYLHLLLVCTRWVFDLYKVNGRFSISIHDEFLTSRVNWVVQSSAVDYLHLLLVCTRWVFDLYKVNGRFSISIHDEVRYLVKSEDRYRAALALQIANLLTRSMFAYKLGMNDLPQSVAFFSAVDIDTVLRKEAEMECVTPSNPHGLAKGYGIPQGEALNIHELLDRINDGTTQPISNDAPT